MNAALIGDGRDIRRKLGKVEKAHVVAVRSAVKSRRRAPGAGAKYGNSHR
jgi:hypothetical protein